MTAATETVEVEGQPVRLRRAEGGAPPVLYLHGVPTSGAIWEPFLARTGGIAPDLPGFGGSSKRGDLGYTPRGLGRWVGRIVDALELERVRLVVQDWGAVGLLWAQHHPERVERLVVLDAVPLLPGYTWHRWARAWRRRGVGELAMGFTVRPVVRRALRPAFAGPGGVPRDFADRVAADLDQGTQRAILELYRAADPDVLRALGRDLHRITAPALVLWGEEDPYLPPSFADAYGAALPHATVERLPGAGHWPWLDRPGVVDRVAAFLDGA